jgi:hypothetical protein
VYHADKPPFPLPLLVFFQVFSTQSYFRRIRTLHLMPTVLPDHNWHLRPLCISLTVSAGNYREKAAVPLSTKHSMPEMLPTSFGGWL